ncbi:BnaC02g41580D [Brassica napus]|uniref:non-specific serine/threonine protein kinase n=1 Tax=Brassica napus TaxID=3708 RepID=A0A078HTX2_BRANA|nr:BnaC02g41580D [Brassica napus]
MASESRTRWVLPHRTKNLKDDYLLGRVLGQGQYGTTFLCTHNETGQKLACKTIPKRKLLRQEHFDRVLREIQIMHHLSEYANVVRIHSTYEDDTSVHLVMELCEGGELFERIAKKGHHSEREAAKLTKTIVAVVEACHSLGVMHRDLKPENFLFSSCDEDSSLKSIDFGLSVFCKPGAFDSLPPLVKLNSVEGSISSSSTSPSAAFSKLVGSACYVAPEVLRRHYGRECDVWSAGVILYMLLCGFPPFNAGTDRGIFRKILQGKLDFETDPWPSISESAKDLIKKMLESDPKRRLTAHQVLCHPWIVDDTVAPDKPLDFAVVSRLKRFSAMNKLKKMALRVVAERLSEEEIGGLKELFKMIDTDNSGTITFEELKDSVRCVGSELVESEIQELLEAADVDESGTIDYGEFLAATIHLNKLEKEENLMAAFTFFDKDASGCITFDELQQAWKQFGIKDSHLEEMIKDIDDDNDGQINYGEFVAMMRKGIDNVGISRRTMRNTLNFEKPLPHESNE